MQKEGYHLNKTGERVSELLSRQFVVPTLSSTPTTQTRSWVDGEYLVDFRIGELCRVRENGEWVFYRLQDTDGGIYVWAKANASEMPDLSDYYNKAEVNQKIEEHAPDLSDYYTKSEVDAKVEEHQTDLSDYYTKEEADSKIDEKIQAINFPEDESIKYASRAEYDAWKEAGAVSDKTLYVIMEGGEPVELLIGSHQIAVKDLGSKGFPYSFPIIF